MKKAVRIILPVFAALLVASLFVLPAKADVNDFSFSSFDADYYLSKDSEGHSIMKVVEKLTAEFKNYNQNHGILRAVPRNYDGHPISFHLESMQRNGVTEPVYEVKRDGDFNVISTRRDEFVNGTQEYTFTYTLKDVTKTFGDHQELYWDANGTGWLQSFGLVTARVHLDKSVRKDFTGAISCYEGPEGSNAPCNYFTTNDSDEEVVFFAATGPLLSHENLSFDLSFKADSFVGYTMTLTDYVPFVLIGLAAILLLLAIILKVIYGRNYPGKGTIIAEYTPPKDIPVLLAAEISGDTSKSVTAQLLDLAVREKIRIIESEKKSWGIFNSKEYTLELINTDGLSPDEERLVRIFFRGSVIGDKYSMKKRDTAKAMAINIFSKAIRKESEDKGFRKKQKKQIVAQVIIVLTIFGLCMLSLYLTDYLGTDTVVPFAFIILTVAILATVLLKLLELRPLTEQGRELYDYMKGLKLYIKMAEADRIKFLQSPDGAQTEKIDTNDSAQMVILYERLLPYAVLFGQEKEWLKELGKYYESTEANPYWYSGNGNFNAAFFASSVSSFSSYANSSSFSSSSGAGGGGGSGGGGGGGGGGGC